MVASDHRQGSPGRAVDEFAHEFGARWPKGVARIVDDIEPLLAFYRWRAVNGASTRIR
ncbi:hypothetical protein EV652_1065 [Kribbella steppae]|uniref:Uncharacterized protein n=1 Tax=Kribbella steppae TaxID=2512223 RepID=A0A4R2HFJ4_9ACTN|nr:hypothetical protein [Kribbella steppae]TCO28023.1 hypothetical protein EV652_1065 [Kribbella steppae]